MRIKRLALPTAAIDFLLSEGFKELYPPQAASVRSGLLKGRSLMVSAPTASGKTLIAMLAILGFLSGGSSKKISGGNSNGDGTNKNNPGKVVYLSPLRALAAEKFTEFKKLERLDLKNKAKVAISTGDYENIQRKLRNSNILVLTNEKMDSIIRHNASWIEDIALVISDEIHLIGDETRGPTLEMILTQLKLLDVKPQIIGLSATVTNSEKIADWLGCKLVQSDWRPVPLFEGICKDGRVKMNNGTRFSVKPTSQGLPVDLGVQAVKQGGQSLIFASTRPRSKSLATKASSKVSDMLDKDETDLLSGISKKILAENERTEMVKTLALLVTKGVAFHHAGLNQRCREVIETEFRKGTIKLLASTPTLAAGVNLPARRVVISATTRYDVQAGINTPISILEYKQLCGRAGRPQYDDYGESIIVAGTTPVYLLTKRYIKGEAEPLESKIFTDKSLRIHTLSVVVTHPGIKRDEILEYFLQTFGGTQSSEPVFKSAIHTSLIFLSYSGLILRKGSRYAATSFGKKTSMLYIDPLTATLFRDALDTASPKGRYTLGFLHLITLSDEFFPKFGLRERDYVVASRLIERHRTEQLDCQLEYGCTRSLLALHAWITESSELFLADTFGIESGDMHRMTENANWLLYCLREIAKYAKKTEMLDELDVLQKRVSYGVKEDLVDLVQVKGIGRVRSRVLFKHGIRDIDTLRKVPVSRLAEIKKIGPTIAANIKADLRKVR